MAVVERPVEAAEDGKDVVGDLPLSVLRGSAGDAVLGLEDIEESLETVGARSVGRVARAAQEGRRDRPERLAPSLPVYGDEIVELIANDRARHFARVLLHREVVRRVAVEILARERLVSVVAVERGAEVVRSALGDDVDDAPGVVAELDVEAVGDDLELTDRLEREGEGDAAAAAVLPEEGVVRVNAVDLDARL